MDYNSEHSFYLDVVQNIDKIPLVKCPVLVIHVSIQKLISSILPLYEAITRILLISIYVFVWYNFYN